MGFFSSFKRHPPKVEETYYAQLSESAIDVNSPMIEEAIEHTVHLAETWPYSSLSDLEKFLSYIKQNYVVPTGEIIPLGDIEFMINNAKTNQPEETGLTWSPVEIRPDSDHFTVETVRNTLNDAETRLNDAITYSDISESLQELLEAAETYADTPLEEMPVLPTEDEYVDAVSKNEPLEIEAMKYQTDLEAVPEQSIAEPVDDAPAFNNSDQPVEPFANQSDNFAAVFNGEPPVSNDEQEGSSQSVSAIEPDNYPHDTPQYASGFSDYAEAPKTIVEPSVASRHFQAVDQFHIEMPLFEIDENLVNQNLTPADERYVLSELEKAKKESNQYLRLSAEKFESTIREKLVTLIDTSEFEAEKQQLLVSDWQEDMKAQISADISQRFVGQKEQAKSQIERQFENDSLAEKERHERTMTSLNQQKDVDIQRSNDLLAEQERQAVISEQTQKIAEQEVYIKQLIAELDRKFNHDVTAKVTEAINHYRPVAIASLDAGYKQIKEQLAQDEQRLTEKHEQAVSRKLEHSKQMLAEHDVVQMQGRISTLSESDLRMNKEVKDLMNELDQSSQTNTQLEAEVDQLHQRLAVAESKNATASQDKHSKVLEDLIAVQLSNQLQQNSQPQPVKKKRSRGTITLVTLLSLLALGGTGFGVYSYQTVEQLKHDQASALQAAKEQSKPKADAKSESDKEKADDFKLLDESLSHGSLGVYKAKYVGKDLKTDDRTYNVGLLLLSQGLVDDAWAVASSNDGHNERLLALLKGQGAG